MSWLYYRTLTFPATDEANKQVPISLSNANFDYSKCNIFGDDLRFGPDPNSSYSFCIDYWRNGTSENSRIMVKVPTAGTTSIVMWYGNSAASKASNPGAAYDFYSDFEDSNLWNVRGPVLLANANEAWNLIEPTVILDTNPQILIGNAQVYKMWYTGGWNSPNIYYAESLDGYNWTRYANAVLANYARSFVIKNGSTYYIFLSVNGDTRIDLYSSPDGINWSLQTTGLLALGTAGQWDDGHLANTYVWFDSNTNKWSILYDGAHDPATAWKTGLATADVITGPYTKSASNPVINPSGTFGAVGYVHYTGGQYYVWGLGTIGTGNLPTEFFRYKGASLTTLALNPSGPSMVRQFEDEGPHNSVGQLGDPYMIAVGNKVRLYYSAGTDGGSPSGNFRIKLAEFTGSFDDLVATNENFYTPSLTGWTVETNVTTATYRDFSHYAGATIATASATLKPLLSNGQSVLGFVLEGYIMFTGNYDGVMFRRSAPNTFYCLQIGAPHSSFGLYRVNSGVQTLIGSALPCNLITNNVFYPFTLRVSPIGEVSFVINGSTMSWTDNVLPAGAIGIQGYDAVGSGTVKLDNFAVRKYWSADPTVTVSSERNGINTKVKINGSWVTANSIKVKQNGAWVNASSVKVRRNGVWN